MKNIKLLFLIVLLPFVGCSRPDSPQVVAENQRNLSRKGFYIGTLPDGRDVVRYTIDNGSSHEHYIYVVNGSISVNTEVSTGKTTRNETMVMINGEVRTKVKY